MSHLKTRHGKSRFPEYPVWKSMLGRCRHHENYAGRGIVVDPRWLRFETFLADMGSRPSALHTIERKDNDGPYSPDNCVWALRAVQNANTRQNVRITFNGETLIVAEWARRVGIAARQIRSRLKAGWSVERALTERSEPCAKLTAAQVEEIRARFSAGGVSQRALGREYGVHGSCVTRIVNAEAWRTPERVAITAAEIARDSKATSSFANSIV